MEIDRRVQVRCYVPGAKEEVPTAARFGSGILVGPRLVLTAGHVVGDASGPTRGRITVTRPDAGPEAYSARVLWYRCDKDVDAALIEVDEGHGWQPPGCLVDVLTRPAQRWGRFIGARPHPVTVFGFPRMQKDPDDGSRYDEQLSGRILPGTGRLAGRYEILSIDPQAPAALPPTSPASGWSGMSGAAVLSEAAPSETLLCGVIRADRRPTSGTRLTATPAHVLLADSAFAALIEQHTGSEPLAEPAEPAALLAPAAPRRDLHSPAMLLRADTEAVTFDAAARKQEIEQLDLWCRAEEPFSVRVLTGPGGHGKTRLARHLTDALRRRGWCTGHLRADLSDTGTHDLAALDTPNDLLLVADYAETRPHLIRRLATHLSKRGHRTRLLLIARADGPWRTDALDAEASVRDLLAAALVMDLAPFLPSNAAPGARPSAFAQAAGDFAALLDRHPHIAGRPDGGWTALAATVAPPADLSDERYDSVLTLQMTALTALLQHGPAPVATTPGQPVEQTLLSHERRYWENTARIQGSGLERLSRSTLETVMAVAAACGAATPAEAEDVVGAIAAVPPEKVGDVDQWLQALYRPAPDHHWGFLEPDRLAEYHASCTLTTPRIMRPILPALLRAASPTQQTRIVTVLARAATAHHNAHRVSERDSTLTALESALDEVSLVPQALDATATALPYPSDVLASLALRLTDELATRLRRMPFWRRRVRRADVARSLSHLSLRLSAVGRWEESVRVQRDAVRIYRWMGSGPLGPWTPDFAESLSNFGNRLSEMGRPAEALAATEEAVAVRRRLAAYKPDAYTPGLASSLSNFGNRLSEMGRPEEALAATEEAVEIDRRLAADNPDHASGLAASLSNLGSQLSIVGWPEEALAAAEEAARIRRQLAASNPDAYTPDLAGSLSNLGNRLSEMGRPAEALAATEEAVTVYRRLAASNASAHTPGLSTSLTNLSGRLSEMGRPEEALAAAEEATEIRRQLAAGNPDAFSPGLAYSLTNLSGRLSEVGRPEEALAAAEEATEIRRRLAAGNPDGFSSDLAASLSNLGTRLSEVGRPEEALVTTEKAVDIERRLASGNPEASSPGLAASLSNLATLLTEVGRPEEALVAEREVVEIARRLAADKPDAFSSDLAASLSNLATLLTEVGRPEQAMAAAEEAVEIRRRLAPGNPDAHEPDLAGSLDNLSTKLSETGQRAEALAAEQEAVAVYRQLAERNPDAYEPAFAASLSNLGIRLLELGQWAQALTAEQESVEIGRRLAANNPDVHEPDLAASLSNLSAELSAVGRREEALAPVQEAAEIYGRLAADDPDAHEPGLAIALANLATRLSELGRPAEALAPVEKAVDIHRRLAVANPGAHAPNLAASLSNLGIRFSELGRREEALAAEQEALEIYRRLAAGNPDAHEPELALTLGAWAWVRYEARVELPEALRAIEEALRLYDKLLPLAPARYVPDRAEALRLQADLLESLGRHREAEDIRGQRVANEDEPGSQR
ncbi:tetratricopeptide repeat protein [Streptomyces cacaoi]